MDGAKFAKMLSDRTAPQRNVGEAVLFAWMQRLFFKELFLTE